MDRSLLAVLSGILSVTVFTLLAGLSMIPASIGMWLPFLGFILCCLVIGGLGRLRILHLILISLIFYMGLMGFLAVNGTLLFGFELGPLSMSQIQLAWTAFQNFTNTLPILPLLSESASQIRVYLGDSLLAIFLEFTVASAFIAVMGLLITGISGFATRGQPLHVVTAPEISLDDSMPSLPTSTSPVAESAPALPAEPIASPSTPPQAMEAPLPMPAPQPIEDAPPPLPSEGGSPSAQAIASLKGKVTKHLKDTGQKVPAGQSRCPHCNATIIRGSQFCNACKKSF